MQMTGSVLLLRNRAEQFPVLHSAWKLVPMGFTTASLINEQRGDILQITTGAKEFDDILDGA